MDGVKHNALRCRWHKERQGRSVQNPDASWGKCFVHKSLIKLVNDLCFFMYRQCLLDLHRFFYTPLCSPSLCVTLRQSSKLKVTSTSLSLLCMVYRVAGLLNRFHLIVLNLMGVMANVLSTRTTRVQPPHDLCGRFAQGVRSIITLTERSRMSYDRYLFE